jgi:glutathione S-transferase
MSNITVYGASGSPFVFKTLIVLSEKGLDHDVIPTIPVTEPLPPDAPFSWITPELRAHTPLKKIPFVRIGDRWLADSSIIAAYLERLHPSPALYPADPWEYARALWFEEYIDGGAYPKLFSTIFFERILAPMLLGRPTDQSIVERAIAEELPVIYSYLDQQIGTQRFLAGGQFSVADAAAASFFRSMQAADAAPDPQRWPNLVRYIKEQHSRPSIARLIAEDAKQR